MHGKSNINLQIWDLPGNPKYRSLTQLYLNDSACIIIVFDIANKESFEALPDFMEILQSRRKSVKGDADMEPLMVLLGNKIDLEQDRAVTKETAQTYAD